MKKEVKLMFTEGTILCTKSGQRYSNAIVVESNERITKILSDFGNEMTFLTEELLQYYEVSDSWNEYTTYEFPFPTIKERVK